MYIKTNEEMNENLRKDMNEEEYKSFIEEAESWFPDPTDIEKQFLNEMKNHDPNGLYLDTILKAYDNYQIRFMNEESSDEDDFDGKFLNDESEKYFLTFQIENYVYLCSNDIFDEPSPIEKRLGIEKFKSGMDLLEFYCDVYDINELSQLEVFEKEGFIDFISNNVNNNDKYLKSKELLKLLEEKHKKINIFMD